MTKLSTENSFSDNAGTIFFFIILGIILYTSLTGNVLIISLSLEVIISVFYLYFSFQNKDVYLDYENKVFIIQSLDESVARENFSELISFKRFGNGVVVLKFKGNKKYYFRSKVEGMIGFGRPSKEVMNQLEEIISMNS